VSLVIPEPDAIKPGMGAGLFFPGRKDSPPWRRPSMLRDAAEGKNIVDPAQKIPVTWFHVKSVPVGNSPCVFDDFFRHVPGYSGALHG
jgi:hypothetical protein